MNATFYKVPVISNWNSAAAGTGGIGGDCGFDPVLVEPSQLFIQMYLILAVLSINCR